MSKALEIVVDNIIKDIETSGQLTWDKEWTSAGLPLSLATGKPYRGFNTFILATAGYANPYWVTWNGAKKLDGHIKEGEGKKYQMILQPIVSEYEDSKGNSKKSVYFRYIRVYNVDQCYFPEGRVPTVEKNDFNPIEKAESIVKGYTDKPEIKHSPEGRAYYRPSDDFVHMPEPEYFKSAEGYYYVLFHELAHSTGHHLKLNRIKQNEWAGFGSHDYSEEELVAEFTAIMLGNMAGIGKDRTRDNNIAYVQNWLKVLKNDKSILQRAGSKAVKAVEWITKPDKVKA